MQSVMILFCFVLFPIYTFAAQPTPAKNQPAGFSTRSNPQLVRDPFAPSDFLFDLVGKQASQNLLGNYGFVRSPDIKIPHMRLRGFVENKNGKKNTLIALLEIKGSGTYVVHEGDEISIDPTTPNNVIRITTITRDSVTVEAGRLGAIRIQR